MKADDGAFWGLGIKIYKRGCGREIDCAGVRKFVEQRPPFHAMLLALCIAQFHRCIKPIRAPSEFKAGRLDLFAAVYIPSRDHFVTNDVGQQNAMKIVAQEAGLPTEISTYARFRKDRLGLV